MTDLIWIGNTLYPRWFVFGTIGVIALVIIVGFIAITSRIDNAN